MIDSWRSYWNVSFSEESLMKQSNIFLQVLLALWVNPLLKVNEVKSVIVMDSFRLEPLRKKREVLIHLFSVENPVYHVTAKQSHLYLVTNVAVYVLVLVNVLENVWSCWTVGKFQLVEYLLAYRWLVTLVEILYRHVAQNAIYLVVCVFVHYVRLHVLLFQFW